MAGVVLGHDDDNIKQEKSKEEVKYLEVSPSVVSQSTNTSVGNGDNVNFDTVKSATEYGLGDNITLPKNGTAVVNPNSNYDTIVYPPGSKMNPYDPRNGFNRTVNTTVEPQISESSELDIIEQKMKKDEEDIEDKVHKADELSDLVGKALKIKLEASLDKEKDKGQANIIFVEGIPDILQAQSRLLGISIDGKCKISAIRKARYAILKAKLESSKDGGMTIDSLLNG